MAIADKKPGRYIKPKTAPVRTGQLEGYDDPTADGALFEIEVPKISLSDRFGLPPFSVLDRRQGTWQDRKRRWLALGIESELGRDEGLTYQTGKGEIGDFMRSLGTTSVFDPMLCEAAFRWFTAPGYTILDPFAGGSVRGLVASVLGRPYTGIDLRPEQVAANRAQTAPVNAAAPPAWIDGNSADLHLLVGDDMFDFVFSCPPYADLEVYSNDPDDLSNMPYESFLHLYRGIIRDAVAHLLPDRFAAWVISDVRDMKGGGHYRALVADTILAFQNAGMGLYNDIIILDPVGTSAARSARPFLATRKVSRVHQHMLVFIKGDAKAATAALGNNDLDVA